MRGWGLSESRSPFSIRVSLSTSIYSVMFVRVSVELLVPIRVFAMAFARLLRWGGGVAGWSSSGL